jgi:hypothetical protein
MPFGPKSIELAGEIVDGVLLLVGFNGGIIEFTLDHPETGANPVARRVDNILCIAGKPTRRLRPFGQQHG